MSSYPWPCKRYRVKSVWWRLKREATEKPSWYEVGSSTERVLGNEYRLVTKVFLMHDRECQPPGNAKAKRWLERYAKRQHRKTFIYCRLDYKQRGLTLTRGRVILTPSRALLW